MGREKVVWKGRGYWLQSSGRYFSCGGGRKRSPFSEPLLHRRIWAEANGSIPKGCAIHHKNGDWRDNRLENLECVDGRKHATDHMLERMCDPKYRKRAMAALVKARDAVARWHGSPEGIAWHSKNGFETWKDRKPVNAKCSVCGKRYKTFFAVRSRFCSRACEQREGYQRHKTAVGKCPECGKEFRYNRYRTQTCCSYLCANRRRGRKGV